MIVRKGGRPAITGDKAHAICVVYKTNSAQATARVFRVCLRSVLTVLRREGQFIRKPGRKPFPGRVYM